MHIRREKLSTMKLGNVVTGEKLAPVHSGEILLQDFIEPMGLTHHKVAESELGDKIDHEVMPIAA